MNHAALESIVFFYLPLVLFVFIYSPPLTTARSRRNGRVDRHVTGTAVANSILPLPLPSPPPNPLPTCPHISSHGVDDNGQAWLLSSHAQSIRLTKRDDRPGAHVHYLSSVEGCEPSAHSALARQFALLVNSTLEILEVNTVIVLVIFVLSRLCWSSYRTWCFCSALTGSERCS